MVSKATLRKFHVSQKVTMASAEFSPNPFSQTSEFDHILNAAFIFPSYCFTIDIYTFKDSKPSYGIDWYLLYFLFLSVNERPDPE